MFEFGKNHLLELAPRIVPCGISYPKILKKTREKSFEVMCASSKRLHTDLDHQKHRSEVIPARKIARQKPLSHFKLQNLSPASAAVREKATQMECSVDKARLARHEDIELDDEQSEELCDVMKKIE